MTEEAQRIAIAEACGWTEISDRGANGINGKHPTEPWVKVIPDYLNDLNAMHKVERALNTSDEQITYWKNTLEFVCNRDNTITLITTAAQRAEAYLRTIGKWEGGSDE